MSGRGGALRPTGGGRVLFMFFFFFFFLSPTVNGPLVVDGQRLGSLAPVSFISSRFPQELVGASNVQGAAAGLGGRYHRHVQDAGRRGSKVGYSPAVRKPITHRTDHDINHLQIV